ncbi:hypothetical protein chiPu_0020453 [Chiloscyllium punctatum]|uniref:Uncharacterized protein n=1 Tax=Chiloscyllium punctatum TaxID=137246 RepID=A0A401RFR7_CHIPU|nr:hypothetical protein [Chiloscyllium punctatum]
MVAEMQPPLLQCVPATTTVSGDSIVQQTAPHGDLLFSPSTYVHFPQAAPGWCSPQLHATLLRVHAGAAAQSLWAGRWVLPRWGVYVRSGLLSSGEEKTDKHSDNA